MKKEPSAYLLLGQDAFSKDAQINKLKDRYFKKEVESFNLDVCYGRDTDLVALQKMLLSLPVKAAKRLVVIREAQHLKEAVKDFILRYLKSPAPHAVLAIDIEKSDPKDEFIKGLLRLCMVYRFKEAPVADAFTLARCIEQRKGEHALKTLHQLLRNGEKPEKIMGGLRYSLLREETSPLEARRRLRLLLECDIDIKTGRLKPALALERFVISLSCLGKPLHQP